MKKILIVTVLILSIVTLNSCSKNKSENNQLLTGKWNVVNDSSVNTNEFFTLSRGDSGIISGNYNGVECGATFSFNSNGILATSFYNCDYGLAPLRDSAKYVVTNNLLTTSIYAEGDCCASVQLNHKISRTYKISNLTANTATLTYSEVSDLVLPKQSTPIEVINLKR